jgi:hypothetical protein
VLVKSGDRRLFPLVSRRFLGGGGEPGRGRLLVLLLFFAKEREELLLLIWVGVLAALEDVWRLLMLLGRWNGVRAGRRLLAVWEAGSLGSSVVELRGPPVLLFHLL